MIDQSKYKDLFISESHDHLDALDSGLIKFEKNLKDKTVAKDLMRHAHTLKGNAGTMGYGEISNLAHSFEGMVENIKNGLSTGGADLLFGALDELRRLIEETKNGDAKVQQANPLVDKVGELEDVDNEAEAEMIKRPEMFRTIKEVKVRTEKLDRLVELAAELLVNKLRLTKTFSEIKDEKADEHKEGLEEYVNLIDELQYQILELRLTPLVQVFNRFPRMIRDLAKKQNKKVKFVITGGDLELDRTVLDVIGEPLVHLLRNAVDHGIDKEGTITLAANRVGDQAIITVKDDGLGIDWQKIRQKKQAANSKLTDTKFLLSGVSTAEEVTEISGRGVGLSVVEKKITELGGRVEVHSAGRQAPKNEEEKLINKGTTFFLHIPVSLAIIKALLVEVNKHTYAVPVSSVARLISLKSLEVKKQANQAVAVIDDQGVPLISMGKVFGLESLDSARDKQGIKEGDRKDEKLNQIVMLAQLHRKRVGFIVDQVESQQDIIVKPLSKKLRVQNYFSAVTILGDGEPVPIVDVEAIAESL